MTKEERDKWEEWAKTRADNEELLDELLEAMEREIRFDIAVEALPTGDQCKEAMDASVREHVKAGILRAELIRRLNGEGGAR